MGTVKIGRGRVKSLPSKNEGRGWGETRPLRFCGSCPDIVHLCRTRLGGSPIMSNPANSIKYDPLIHRTGSLPNVPYSRFHTSYNACKGAKCCPCAFPCGPCGCSKGCCCLPPPCNTPPKCIQYMTGYYYYPYGFWFCGPYHVSGTCVPAGPVSPGGPCGPCPPCGCCPCPPPSAPCPKCPCPKCCTCLSPIPTAVVGGDPEPRCQSVQSPQPSPRTKLLEVSYPLPPDQHSQREGRPQGSSKGGISRFFPFNAVPALDPSWCVPRGSVHVCPYSTQPLTQSCPQAQYAGCTRLFPEHNPVYCTPCIKARTRPRQPSSYPNETSKKSDYYEKKESRSPIQHKRTKRVNCEFCPVLESPRALLTQEERDRPTAFPGTFQYTNIPNYKKPFPPQPDTRHMRLSLTNNLHSPKADDSK